MRNEGIGLRILKSDEKAIKTRMAELAEHEIFVEFEEISDGQGSVRDCYFLVLNGGQTPGRQRWK